MFRQLVILLFLVTGFLPLHAQDTSRTIIHNVNIVDVSASQVIAGRSIIISGSTIVAIEDAGPVEYPTGTRVIDGANLYAMPGLADMHVHMGEADLPLFLANGITTVVEMNGSPEKLALRERVESGDVPGPRIYMTSPLLAGTQQNFAYELVTDAAAAERLVAQSQRLGYDFIKVYDGLTRESYSAVVATARALGIPLLGHIPGSVNLTTVLDDGFKSIEHVEQIARAEVGHSFDSTAILAIVARFEGRTTAVTPTLAAMEILNSQRSSWFDSLYEREEMRFAPVEVSAWWNSMRASPAAGRTLQDTAPGGNSPAIEFYRELTQQLHQAGVLLLAGTDTPNPLLVPGFSLHHELEALSRAGLSNAQVLAMATTNAATYLQAETEFGDIRAGVQADILLLEENPLDALSALRAIKGIFTQAQWLDSSALAAMLN